MPDASVQLGPGLTELTVNGRSMFLENMYLSSVGSPERRDATIANAVSLLSVADFALPGDFAVAREHLLPRVRDVASRGIGALGSELRLDAGVSPVVERPFAGHLREVLVYDMESSVTDVTVEAAAKWNVSESELFLLARRNLASRSSAFVARDGMFVAEQGDTYDAARVLLVEEQPFRSKLRGRPVAFLPNRTTLLVMGEDDVDAITRASDASLEAEGGYPISVQPVVATDGGWVTWRPTRPALAARIAGLRRAELQATYGEQKALLDALHARHGVDISVANLLEKDQRTLATWSEGVHSWLPEADDVAFSSETAQGPLVRTASFETALKVMGGSMRRLPDLEPPRWEVTTFPSERQFRAMRVKVLKRKGSP